MEKLLHTDNILSMLLTLSLDIKDNIRLYCFVLFFSYKKISLHLVFDVEVIDSSISGGVIATPPRSNV